MCNEILLKNYPYYVIQRSMHWTCDWGCWATRYKLAMLAAATAAAAAAAELGMPDIWLGPAAKFMLKKLILQGNSLN